jgi:hypothetical protein
LGVGIIGWIKIDLNEAFPFLSLTLVCPHAIPIASALNQAFAPAPQIHKISIDMEA